MAGRLQFILKEYEPPAPASPGAGRRMEREAVG